MLTITTQQKPDHSPEWQINKIKCLHRTEQANVIRNMKDIIEAYSYLTDSNIDGRNEAAVEFSKKVNDLDLFIPYV